MGNRNLTQETLIKAVKGEQLYEMASEPEELNSIDAETLDFIESIKANPQFKDMTFSQLSRNLEFRQKLKEYRLNNSSPEDVEAMEILNSVLPKKYVKPNNKLSNKVTKDIVDKGEFNLIVSSGKAKKEVFTKVMLTYDNSNIKLSGQKYTPYDREVYDGVVTLYVAGNDTITPAMVYRAMNGLTETEKIRPETLKKVAKSLDKSRFIRTVIDYTDEVKMYNRNIEKTTYDGYLLAAKKITVKINGEEHEAYKLLDKPILYEYAQISGQIVSVSMKYLQTKNAVRGTDEVIIIRGYLLRQIEWMRNEKISRSDNITYQAIYDELEISRVVYDEIQYKKKTAKIRNHIKAILEEWKQQGYIIDYAEYKNGKTLIGISMMI
ncbi:MAG: hypothetical protein FWC97_04140 [Treponema sp.]|nr:hypothetical protein [Treponema sp.]